MYLRLERVELLDIEYLGICALVRPDELLRRWGLPGPGDGCQVSGEYVFVNTDTGVCCKLHDWRQTTLYTDTGADPLQLWRQKLLTLRVSHLKSCYRGALDFMLFIERCCGVHTLDFVSVNKQPETKGDSV